MDDVTISKTLRDHKGLKEEILKEMAEALGAAGERVDTAIDRLHRAKEQIDRLIELNSPHEEEVMRYNGLRKDALECYRFLIIHREAVGFRNHKTVEEKYIIPPPISPKD